MAMTRRRSNLSHMTTLAMCMALLVLLADVVRAEDECCATCIGKQNDKPYTYDPLVFKQCNTAKGVCCFNCGAETAAAPQIVNSVGFASDKTTPQVKAGTWIQITWSNIARVTYETYQKSQAKTTTVKNASAEAQVKDSTFFICPRSEGTVVVRGWGKDPCRVATVESTIEVLPGSGNGTCADSTPTAPSNSDKSAKKDTDDPECNESRGTIKVVDGKKTCVCLNDWSGPPDCSGTPLWKTLITIGGGIAALLSIAVSVKAFMNSRKAKAEEKARLEREEAILEEESITIAGGKGKHMPPPQAVDEYYHQPPATTSYGMHLRPDRVSDDIYQQPRAQPVKDHKEYSL